MTKVLMSRTFDSSGPYQSGAVPNTETVPILVGSFDFGGPDLSEVEVLSLASHMGGPPVLTRSLSDFHHLFLLVAKLLK